MIAARFWAADISRLRPRGSFVAFFSVVRHKCCNETEARRAGRAQPTACAVGMNIRKDPSHRVAKVSVKSLSPLCGSIAPAIRFHALQAWLYSDGPPGLPRF